MTTPSPTPEAILQPPAAAEIQRLTASWVKRQFRLGAMVARIEALVETARPANRNQVIVLKSIMEELVSEAEEARKELEDPL